MDVRDDVHVLVLAGRVGHSSALELAAALDTALARPKPLTVLDFELVDYVSGAALGVMEAALDRATRAGGRLVLTGVCEPVRVVLELGGLLARVAIEPSRDAAVLTVRLNADATYD